MTVLLIRVVLAYISAPFVQVFVSVLDLKIRAFDRDVEFNLRFQSVIGVQDHVLCSFQYQYRVFQNKS